MFPPVLEQLISGVKLPVANFKIQAQVQMEKTQASIRVLARQHNVVVLPAHNPGTDAIPVLVQEGYQLPRSQFAGNDAIHIRSDSPGIVFIAVQNAIRYTGLLESRKHTQ